jgi:hypothetical protein
MITEKPCSKCKTVKPLADFNRRRLNGFQSVCRACQAARAAVYAKTHAARILELHRLRKYGLSRVAFSGLYAEQNGRCAVCSRLLVPRGDQARQPHVDHDHKSGKVRGLLCGSCNRGIGLFKDRPTTLRAAATYLERRK